MAKPCSKGRDISNNIFAKPTRKPTPFPILRCTMCSASTPAMFKTKRSFVMHFCSVHGKDTPLLKPVAEALKTQSAAKRTLAEMESKSGAEGVAGAAASEPPSKRTKRDSGTPAGLLAIAEGLKKNGMNCMQCIHNWIY